ncbi:MULTISPECIES: hypothetical protein [unclassified Streptomyces]|uniref:hypothetical protein n=1 Tax=unclassified Streptomyces TaxID=2593676 RepID=UPI0035DCA86B
MAAAMVQFCAANGIAADIAVLASPHATTALDRLRKKDVRYRIGQAVSDLN